MKACKFVSFLELVKANNYIEESSDWWQFIHVINHIYCIEID